MSQYAREHPDEPFGNVPAIQRFLGNTIPQPAAEAGRVSPLFTKGTNESSPAVASKGVNKVRKAENDD